MSAQRIMDNSNKINLTQAVILQNNATVSNQNNLNNNNNSISRNGILASQVRFFLLI